MSKPHISKRVQQTKGSNKELTAYKSPPVTRSPSPANVKHN